MNGDRPAVVVSSGFKMNLGGAKKVDKKPALAIQDNDNEVLDKRVIDSVSASTLKATLQSSSSGASSTPAVVAVAIPLINNNWKPSDIEEGEALSKARNMKAKHKGGKDEKSNGKHEKENGNANKENEKEGTASTGTGTGTGESEAAAALLSEARKQIEDRDSEDKKSEYDISQSLLMANAVPGIYNIEDEQERFKHDVAMRVEALDASTSEGLMRYEKTPVEMFGIGALMGMGWKPGMPIGKTNQVAVEPIEFLPRGDRRGLGASMGKPTEKKGPKILKQGQTRDEKPTMRVAPDADGRVRHFRKISERLIPVHSLRLRETALVEIMHGPHARLYGRVAKIGEIRKIKIGDEEEQDQICDIKLNISNQLVAVPRHHFEILDENAIPKDHPAFFTSAPKTKNANARSRSRSRSPKSAHKDKDKKKDKKHKRSRSRSPKSKHSNGKDRERERDKDREREKARDKERELITWVVPHIRVRVISKSLGDGKFYQQKGKVEDVLDRSKFLLIMDNGTLVENVRQKQVETALPKAGGRVLVVGGTHKGIAGKLLERSAQQSKAVVQLDSDLQTVVVGFEDLAELVGDHHGHMRD